MPASVVTSRRKEDERMQEREREEETGGRDREIEDKREAD